MGCDAHGKSHWYPYVCYISVISRILMVACRGWRRRAVDRKWGNTWIKVDETSGKIASSGGAVENKQERVHKGHVAGGGISSPKGTSLRIYFVQSTAE